MGGVITTYLVEHPWLTTAALLISVTGGPALALAVAARRRLAMWLGVGALVPVAALTLFPTSRQLEVGCVAEWTLPTLPAVELMANVVLLILPVLLLGVATRRPLVVFLGASGASAAIETLQAFATALGRSCSTNDWLANSVGAALGAVLAWAVMRGAAALARRRAAADAG